MKKNLFNNFFGVTEKQMKLFPFRGGSALSGLDQARFQKDQEIFVFHIDPTT